MLDENRLIYEEVADAYIPDWKTIDKNHLIRMASELPNGPTRDSYVAAIILRYWNKIGRFYSKCKLVATQEDVHAWLTMAVLYAIDNKPWNNPESSIYNDKNGPDKVVNRVMECRRITFYQQLNRFNRKINSAILSLDSLTDDYKDSVCPTYNEDYIFEAYDLVIRKFKQGEYMMSFLLDAMLTMNLSGDEDNYKKFMSHINSIDDEFCQEYADRYGLPLDDIKCAVTIFSGMRPVDMRKNIQYNLIKLRNILKEE